MGVKAFVAKLEDVPEDLRTDYVPVEGGFLLKPEGFDSPEARAHYDKMIAPGLKSALEKEKEERRIKAEIAAKYSDLGLPPERLKSLVEDYNSKVEEAKKKIDPQLLADMQEQARLRQQTWESEKTSLVSQLEALTVDRELNDAIAAEGGNAVLLKPYLKQYVRLVKEGDAHVVRVVKSDGSPRIGDAEGNPMSIRQLVSSLKTDDQFKGAFSATVLQGAGTEPGDTRKAAVGDRAPKSRKDFPNMAAKLDWIDKNGRPAFEALPAE